MAEYIEREAIKYEMWAVGPLCSPLMCVRKATIDSIPAADVAPVVHGRWVYEKTYQGMKCVCSECGEIPECFEPNYCPNCGARMDGE